MITFRARFPLPPILLRDRAYLCVSNVIGNPVGWLEAANNNTEALAHCPLCGCWLRDSEGCLHIPPVGGL